MKHLALCFFAVITGIMAYGQGTLTGHVLNQSDEPLVGANVVVKETYTGAVTNNEGKFTIGGLSSERYVIQISHVGYQRITDTVNITQNTSKTYRLERNTVLSDEVIIKATRAGVNTPTAHSEISMEEIDNRNRGKDLPFLLSSIPSLVTTSDAGAGVGYTGLRIRGTDVTRINVTVNGIPLNDPESHGVFWVNMPDFSSSLNSIQVQRGVGTSTNGAAAFGATINLETLNKSQEPTVSLDNSFGSFNTIRNNVEFGTGIINDHFSVEGRLSRISSDGFIDRAEADLKSFYLQGGYYGENTLLKAVVFSGKERTYQAWWGVPKVRLNDNLEGMRRYEEHGLYTPEQTEHMINSDSRTYNYYTYDNEIDNYQQDHYQLHFSHEINAIWNVNTSLHFTHGEGYFEQYLADDAFSNYGLPNIGLTDSVLFLGDEAMTVADSTISSTDLVRQKWLDNDFYGLTWSLNYRGSRMKATWGGGANEYIGDHFGDVIWAQFLPVSEKDYEWYSNTGTKRDISTYAKFNYNIIDPLYLFVDLQYRYIGYSIDGIHDDFRDLTMDKEYHFFNPKVGLKYNITSGQSFFASYARANREPSRNAFRDADPGEDPRHETLDDIEVGYELSGNNFLISANAYYMLYDDQLVMTGEINNVGSAILTNVEESYRRGVELELGIKPWEKLEIRPNITLSQNHIKDFTEYVDDWDNGGQIENDLGTTDLAFSPSVIANNILSYEPFNGMQINLISKYVGDQYIDNTSNDNQKLDAYFVNDIEMNYDLELENFADMSFSLGINNIFDEKYETYAWVYRYSFMDEYHTMDGYFPQAGTHFLAGIKMKF